MRVMDKPIGDFVKLHRSLLEWEWYHDLPVRVLFLHLMLEVNWKPGRFEGHDIPPGSVPTSTDKLAAKSGLTRQSVRTALDKLKSTNEITIQATKRFSIVTLANWANYQHDGKKATSRTTHRATGGQHVSNTQATTIEEGKKERRKEEESAQAHQPINSIEDFKARCSEVIAANPDRLAISERKGFFDYWTEKDAKGRMRFEQEKFFDLGRRMDTWQRNANKRPERFDTVKPSPTAKPWVN